MGRKRGGQIQLLVAPAQWTTTMGIKRLFENSDYPARVIGAGNAEAALSQVRKNDRYTAILIQWEEAGSDGMELAYSIKERGKPYVVAYQRHWSRDDIRRALQLGVDSLLLDPFTPQDLVNDLQSIADRGVSVSRKQILDGGGAELLEPDPGLWDDQADDWRERMMGMADNMNRPWSEDMSDRASHMEVSVRRKTQIEHLSPTMARAVLEVLDQGRDRVPEITAKHKVDSGELLHVMAAVEKFAVKHGGPTRIPLLMDEVLKREDDAQQEARSPRLMVLKRVARVVIRSNGKPGRRRDALNETIRKFLGVPPKVLRGMTANDRFNLAMRFLMTDDEADALDQIGFVVVKQLVIAARSGNITQLHIDALNSLLGFDGRHVGMNPKKLIKKLAVINPVPVLMDIDLRHLQIYRDTVADAPPSDDPRLLSALEQLIEVARPMGPIDQKRLKDLTQAIRQELPVLVGRPAWRSMLHSFEAPLDLPMEQLLGRLKFLIGARSKRSSDLLHKAIRDLLDVGKNSMDAARFAEFCRQASSEPLSKDVIAAYAGETHDQFTPDKVDRTGASEKRAMIEEALSSFGRLSLDLDQIRQSLPPAPRHYSALTELEMTRVRVLAAVLESRPIEEQIRIVETFLKGYKFNSSELDALESMLGEGPLIDKLRGQFHDPTGAFREGFDYELDTDDGDDGNTQNFDYDDYDDEIDDEFDEFGDESSSPGQTREESDGTDWDNDDIDSLAGPLEGGVFDIGAEPLPPPVVAPSTATFDLGLDELEMELDLDAGVFDIDLDSVDEPSVSFDPNETGFDLGSMDRSRNRRSSGPSAMDAERRRESSSRAPSQQSPQRARKGFGSSDSFSGGHDEDDFNLSYGSMDESPYGSSEGSDQSLDINSRMSGFDLGPPREGFDLGGDRSNRRRGKEEKSEDDLPLTFEGALDLEAIKVLIEEGHLKRAARMLHSADPEVPDLSEGLNYVALQAYLSERHHAAHMLWTRAYELGPIRANLLYNLAHLRVDLGRYDAAEPIVAELLELKPHLSLAKQLEESIRKSRGES